MSWNYNPGLITTSTLMQVRRLIGDVLSGRQLMQDEEINWTVGRYSTIYGAAAECCRNIALQYATSVDLVQGELKNNYSQISKQFYALARDLEVRGQRGLLPYAGGISAGDKDTVASNSDRVPPAFNRNQFDDLLPVGPVGEQTPVLSPPDQVDTDSATFP